MNISYFRKELSSLFTLKSDLSNKAGSMRIFYYKKFLDHWKSYHHNMIDGPEPFVSTIDEMLRGEIYIEICQGECDCDKNDLVKESLFGDFYKEYCPILKKAMTEFENKEGIKVRFYDRDGF